MESLQSKKNQVKKDLRKHNRKPCAKPALFSSESRYYAGQIVNISRGGFFIKTRGNFTLGQLINLVIPGTKIDKGTMLVIEVVHEGCEGIGVRYKHRIKNWDFIKDRGGTRSGTDRRKMFISGFFPERRSGQDRRKGADRRRLKYLACRRGLNLSGAFRDLD